MLALFAFTTTAHATYPEAVAACLDVLDVACADRALATIGAVNSSDPDVLAAVAHTRFYDGDYPPAYDAMAAAVRGGFDDQYAELPLYERTMYATAGWVEEVRGRFAVRFRPGIDALLVDDAFAAIQGSDRSIAPLLGGSPPGISRVELFPDGRSFIAASSLDREDVETTGVVGLAKWSRLLVTSPRALPRGYPWQDTIAHEYIHLVVAHHTRDRAPVWLQEAIAKYLDARWRDGRNGFRLTVRQQGLLADALANNDLVTFAEMHPSLAKLPDADRAGLAYAQLATLMQFCFQEGGDDVLLRALPQVADGIDARMALATAAGFRDGDVLEAAWRAWIEQQPLHGKQLANMPTVLDGGDEMSADPVLAERQDLARFVTLGDLLREGGFAEASLVEYAKAIPNDQPPPPTVTNRIASVRLELGDARTARAMLEQSLADYPEVAATHATLGEIHLAEGRPADALVAFDAAVAINPFDPISRDGAVRAARALGDTAAVAKHEHALRVRARGGDDVTRPPLHMRTGTYELPSREDTPPPEE
jgi:tetratricopeptide (TPR) repeat protein